MTITEGTTTDYSTCSGGGGGGGRDTNCKEADNAGGDGVTRRQLLPQSPSSPSLSTTTATATATRSTTTTSPSSYSATATTTSTTKAKITTIIQIMFRTVPIFVWTGLRLMLFVVSLSPAFVRFAWYYFISSNRTSVRYNDQSCRQTLDIYHTLPSATSQRREGGVDDDSATSILATPAPTAAAVATNLSPVIVFYTGGGWIIGYKMWGALMARVLSRVTVTGSSSRNSSSSDGGRCGGGGGGVVVVMPDVRNYPWWGTVPDMVDDVDTSMQWVMDNIRLYGGDPTNVIVVGQSAGGHLALMSILNKIMSIRHQHEDQKSQIQQGQRQNPRYSIHHEDSSSTPFDSLLPPENDGHRRIGETGWKPSDLKGFIGVSSPCSLEGIQHVFQQMGLNENLVDRIFGHRTDDYDPLRILKNLVRQQQQQQYSQVVGTWSETEGRTLLGSHPLFDLKNELPPAIKFYHGTNDRTVPYEGSEQFYNELRLALRLGRKSCTNDTRGNNDDGHNCRLTSEEFDIPLHDNYPRESHDIQLVLYDGWSHTDLILEGPMDADHTFHYDLFCDVKRWTTETTSQQQEHQHEQEQEKQLVWPNDDDPVIRDRLCPHFLVVAGRFFMPF